MSVPGQCCIELCLPHWCLLKLQGWRSRSAGPYRLHAPIPNAMPGAVPGSMPYDPPPPYSPTAPNQCRTAQPVEHPSRLYPAPGQLYPVPAPGPYPMASYPQQPGLPQQTVYHVPDAFDAGARFTHSEPTIPPPPPGVPPNAAQLAAMQGNAVVVGQKKGNFWTTGAGGGYTFW
ncbi:DAZ-associated protein 2-like isoform X1 [Dermacentor albipictus]|uniref:DAZ-associated protein 2-like isoform X1 n=1 Tax=Dermacentor albipictus TaxID=60249 RepID=UPI0031FD15D0